MWFGGVVNTQQHSHGVWLTTTASQSFKLCDFQCISNKLHNIFFFIKLPFVLLHKKEELGIFQEEIEMHKIRRYIDIF